MGARAAVGTVNLFLLPEQWTVLNRLHLLLVSSLMMTHTICQVPHYLLTSAARSEHTAGQLKQDQITQVF